MKRNELYAKVKSMNLAGEIKEVFGKNFTNVPNDKLEAFINKKSTKKVEKKCCGTKATTFKDVVVRMVSILQSNKLINKKDAEFIMQGL